ncbi:hypothetical protein V5J73_03720 [Flavobacterium sp. KS-LB2]|uniref:hypothetical protein n=1 Tax=Flavobacterium sp. KS-LB2 TaxID=3120525 RepID=UPI0030D2632C
MKQTLKKLTATLGYQTTIKQIIFMSDDWGSVRLKSMEVREALREKGIDVDANRFDQFDTLETNSDMEALFEVLTKYKDHLGNHPCITAVTNVGNPDFEKIRADHFQNYHFETIEKTYKRYPHSDTVLSIVKQGIEQNIFVPQSHGREHVQVNWWMEELQNKQAVARKVFEQEFFFLGHDYLQYPKRTRGIEASFDVWDQQDVASTQEITKSSLSIFKDLYGYSSKVFTPPAMFYNPSLESILKQEGVQWLDVGRILKIPQINGKDVWSFNYLGRKKKSGLSVLVRNAVFETNFSIGNNGVADCLRNIQQAFNCKQPAIISNHRASFVGGIVESNRIKGLRSLDLLLSEILKKWPDVEFISVNEIGNS